MYPDPIHLSSFHICPLLIHPSPKIKYIAKIKKLKQIKIVNNNNNKRNKTKTSRHGSCKKTQ